MQRSFPFSSVVQIDSSPHGIQHIVAQCPYFDVLISQTLSLVQSQSTFEKKFRIIILMWRIVKQVITCDRTI